MTEMPQGMGYKRKILVLADIFFHMTDDEHPLTAQQICQELAARGISCERKAIYDDIEVLMDTGMDIVQMRSPKRGYFLASRTFELAEVHLLMDAVQSAAFLTSKKTRELMHKLSSLTSVYHAKDLIQQCVWDGGIKCDNEEIYYNIDLLQRAITQQKKIMFYYFHQGVRSTFSTEKKLVSPYGLIWWDNQYYCIGNYEKFENLSHYRIDRMRSVTISSEPVRPFSQLAYGEKTFHAAEYMKRTVNMFSGFPDNLILLFDPELDEAMMDQFGTDIVFRRSQNGWYRLNIRVHISEGLVSWIMQFGPRVEVIAPQSLREIVKRRIEKMQQLYQEKT